MSNKLRVAIVHYHLRPGGVTRVIQSTLSALSEVVLQNISADAIQTVVLTGEPPTPSMPISSDYAIVEDLKYSTSSNFSVEQVSTQLETAAKQKLGGLPDVWHIHNHSLGKNLIVPEIVYHLAKKGHRLLLQIHDLAENGRHSNYKLLRDYFRDSLKRLYPQGSHIHYALINQRDLKFLKTAGVEEEHLHYLPNAVSIEKIEGSESPKQYIEDKRLFLYPTRAIRRKNLGEFLLWSAMVEEGDLFATTRAPKNLEARPVYDDWVAFAQSLKLPVKFAIGEEWKGDFTSLLKSAHALVTTSIMESFGLAFLEAYLGRRQLFGRKLPEITDEFEQMDIDLSMLYDKLLIPTEWVGRDRFYKEVQTALPQAYESYGRTVRSDDVEQAVQAAMIGEYIDFGRLNEPLQKLVIERIVREPSLKSEIIPPTLEPSGEQYTSIIHRNCEIVKTQFNLQQYGKRLLQIYQTVVESETGSMSEINADVLLDKFLAAERFWLLST